MLEAVLASLVVCAGGCGLAAAEVIVSDGEFAAGTWVGEELPFSGSGGSAGRIEVGGNPGAAWQVSHIEFAPGLDSILAHRELTASYQFGVDGAIPVGLRYRLDARADGGIDPFRQELRFLVTADGIDYVSTASFVIDGSEWVERSSGFLTIDDFARLDGDAGVPDFTGELRFGFSTRIASGPSTLPKFTVAQYDNFELELYVPGVGTMGALGVGGLLLSRRRR
jgi:hypothetical protein